jgi:DNA-directed RNA polymerase alpha subunit
MDYDKLENLQLETRTYNVLMREGYTKIYEVVDDLENHPDKIKNLRNLGNKSFEDLVNKINKYKNNGEM